MSTKKSIKEYTSFVNGNPTFSGGSYGFGGTAQLATKKLDPSTQKIADQEAEERDQNAEHLKNLIGNPKHTSEDSLEYKDYSINSNETVKSRQETDMFAPAPHGPGSSKDNNLVNPKTFVPFEDPKETDEYLIDDYIEEITEDVFKQIKENDIYRRTTNLDLNPNNWNEKIGHTTEKTSDINNVGMGAVLLPKNFIPEDEISKINNRNPITGEKTIEEIEEEFKSKAQAKYFYNQANKKNSKGRKWKKMADEFSSKTNFSNLPDKLDENYIKLEKYIKKLIKQELKGK